MPLSARLIFAAVLALSGAAQAQDGPPPEGRNGPGPGYVLHATCPMPTARPTAT